MRSAPAFYSYFDFCLCFVLIFILFEKITFVQGQQVRWRIKNKSKGNKNKKDQQSWYKGKFLLLLPFLAFLIFVKKKQS